MRYVVPLLSIIYASHVVADCTPNFVSSGDTVTCTVAGGAHGGTIGNGSQNNVTVNIEAGAEINAPGIHIDLGNNAVVNNYGVLNATGQSIQASGTDNISITNHERASITTLDNAQSVSIITFTAANTSVVNNGTIYTEGTDGIPGFSPYIGSIMSLSGGQVNHINTGQIDSVNTDTVGATIQNAGLLAAQANEYNVVNTGSISATGSPQNSWGVASNLNNAFHLTNGVAGGDPTTAIITSDDIGVHMEHNDDVVSNIVNYGTIQGDNYAIASDLVSITYVGFGGNFNSIENIHNYGVLIGDIELGTNDDSFVQDLSYGTVEFSDTANGGDGDDVFTVQNYGSYAMDTNHAINFETFNVFTGAEVEFADGSTHIFTDESHIGAGSTLLAANSSLTSAIINNSGILSLQNDAGNTQTTSLIGDYVQLSRGMLALDLGADSGTNDVLDITGNAALDGTLSVAAGGSYDAGDLFDVITATGTISGNFATEALPVGYEWDVLYDPNVVRLTVLGLAAPAATCGNVGNQNQLRVCHAIYNSTILSPTQDTLNSLSQANFEHALQSLHAESYHSSQEISRNAATGFAGLMRDRVAEQRQLHVWRKDTKDFDVWAKTYGDTAELDADAPEYMGYEHDQFAFAAGVDKFVSKHLQLGASVGYNDAILSYDAGYADNEMNGLQAGLYAVYMKPDWYVDTMLSYGLHRYDLERHIDLTTEKMTADSGYDMHVFSAHIEAGRDIEIASNTFIEPVVALGYHYSNSEDDITETGAGRSNLVVDDIEAHYLTSQLGVRLAHKLYSRPADARLYVKADWEHEFIDDTRIDARFAADEANTRFYSKGQNVPQDRFTAGIGGAVVFSTTDINLYGEYNYSTASDYAEHRASAGFKVPLQ